MSVRLLEHRVDEEGLTRGRLGPGGSRRGCIRALRHRFGRSRRKRCPFAHQVRAMRVGQVRRARAGRRGTGSGGRHGSE
ncbi:hypothetical protein A3768_1403 [Ralstonia solanacearum]|nr:hypothetical protein A3768_1403 [Ralstonia solanacearum]